MKILYKALPAALALSLLLTAPVFAGETKNMEIDTQIPGQHTITVEIPDGGGHAEYNGKTVEGSVQVPRQKDAVIKVSADNGGSLTEAKYNDAKIEADGTGKVTLPNVTCDGTLVLTFKQGGSPSDPSSPSNPSNTSNTSSVPTGDARGEWTGIWVGLLVLSLAGVFLVIVSRRRRLQ